MKVNKKKKGFTLIELIVVIAILGILALIAIPRLAGFSDKAKQADDKEYGNIMAHSLQTLVASGDAVLTSDTADTKLTIDATGAVTTITNLDTTKTTLASVQTELYKLEPQQALKSVTGTDVVTVTIAGSNNAISVTLP